MEAGSGERISPSSSDAADAADAAAGSSSENKQQNGGGSKDGAAPPPGQEKGEEEKPSPFEEIILPSAESGDEEGGEDGGKYVDAYVAEVQPKQCGPLVARLSREDAAAKKKTEEGDDIGSNGNNLSHLRRVRRTVVAEEPAASDGTAAAAAAAEEEDDDGQQQASNPYDADTGIAKTKAPAERSNNSKKKKKRKRNNGGNGGRVGDGDADASKKKKKKKLVSGGGAGNGSQLRLEVLLGEAEVIDEALQLGEIATAASAADDGADGGDEGVVSAAAVDAIRKRFGLDVGGAVIRRVRVPRRGPESELEYEEFRAVWPTTYFPNKTAEHRARELMLTPPELEQMEFGMAEAVKDALANRRLAIIADGVKNGTEAGAAAEAIAVALAGTVVVSPASGEVVARSSDELEAQGGIEIAMRNPALATSAVLAVQAVSRTERSRAVECGGTERSAEFQNSQYLCTGYDVYCTREPSPYEAMAFVHARIRRLVFLGKLPDEPSVGDNDEDKDDDAGCGGITGFHVHALPGTNHSYRAFECRGSSDLGRRCHRQLCGDEGATGDRSG